ncbi:hypothetical protein L249_6675 [Ophiocordyceps polyrhachis-furcata BCC 54312]|uniref:Uncharacterized protein n=1 Tax=Ophiocordyceps polyrhachis-furcata BCC 54312 TaxID=1330021 RepID=A0A367LKU5_9HYPO|nr:hypothetical protein L249_6675 [Ophiocordyceps polyrhachis-furcata BCC 54312]
MAGGGAEGDALVAVAATAVGVNRRTGEEYIPNRTEDMEQKGGRSGFSLRGRVIPSLPAGAKDDVNKRTTPAPFPGGADALPGARDMEDIIPPTYCGGRPRCLHWHDWIFVWVL